MLKTVGDENIGEIGGVKNQAKAGGAPRNTFTNFRQSEAGQANRVTEDNEGQEPSQQQDALTKHLQALAQLGSELNKLATD